MSGFNSNQQRMRMMYQQNPGQQQVRSLFCHNLTDENVLFCNQTNFNSKWFMLRFFFTKFRLYIIDQRWHNPRNFFELWLQYPITLNTIHLKHRCSEEWFGILFEGWNQSEKLCEIKSPLAMTDALSFYRSINVLRHSKNLIALSASSKAFVPAQKPILLNANHLMVWHSM